jgi:hypothetical protein
MRFVTITTDSEGDGTSVHLYIWINKQVLIYKFKYK